MRTLTAAILMSLAVASPALAQQSSVVGGGMSAAPSAPSSPSSSSLGSNLSSPAPLGGGGGMAPASPPPLTGAPNSIASGIGDAPPPRPAHR